VETEAGRQLDQFDAAARTTLAQGFQRLFDTVGRRRLILGEQTVQLRQRQRLVGGKQGGFDDAGDQGLVHGCRGSVGCKNIVRKERERREKKPIVSAKKSG